MRIISVLILAVAGNLIGKPVESAHVAGPAGLVGWTESVTLDEVKEQGRSR
jgi:hypothetical protein